MRCYAIIHSKVNTVSTFSLIFSFLKEKIIAATKLFQLTFIGKSSFSESNHIEVTVAEVHWNDCCPSFKMGAIILNFFNNIIVMFVRFP